MDVIILAGGLGTRIRSVTKNLPKVMIDLNGKPLLEHTFNYLKNFNVQNVILAVGYKKEYIKKYFGNQYENINIIYSEEKEQLGTGGAIKKALNYTDEENVIVMNGDLLVNVDLDELYRCHINQENDVESTLTIKKMQDYERYGTIVEEDGFIKKFKEKEYTKEGFINVGIYVINKSKFVNENPEKIFSIEKDYFEKITKIKKLYTYKYSGEFLDVGIPEDYIALTMNKIEDFCPKRDKL